MLERRRLIICVILLSFNFCVLVWRMSWDRVKLEMPQERKLLLKKNRRSTSTGRSLDFSISNTTEFGIIPIDDSDSHRLIDILDFEYTLQQPACSQNIQGIIMVHSAPQNSKKRHQIRETWANRSLLRRSPLRVIFLLGNVQDVVLQVKLTEENEKNGDLVQGNFLDDYRNMTYKHVMALKWFLQWCTHAQLLIKVDDDIFVNTPTLLKYAQHAKFPSQSNHDTAASDDAIELFNPEAKDLLLCSKTSRSLAKRTYRSKWRVSFQEYPNRYYPPYCFGYAIIYSSDVIARLYASAQQQKFFWIDDVHITGILAQLNGIEITSFSNHLLNSEKRDKLLAQSQPNDNELEFIFAEHDTSLEQMYKLWEVVAAQEPTYRKLLAKSHTFMERVNGTNH